MANVSVTIPTTRDPYVVVINRTVYSYPAGSTQSVPAEVAAAIDAAEAMTPAPATYPEGYVLTMEADGSPDWAPVAAGSITGLADVATSGAYEDLTGAPSAAEYVAYDSTDVGGTLEALIEALVNAGLMEPEPEPEPDPTPDPDAPAE